MNKSSFKMRAVAATALAVVLAACGGTTTVSLGGSVSGLITSGLVLANGAATVAIPANATTYTFPDQIDDSGAYDVTIKTQPPRLTCQVSNGKGVATGIAINVANVFCLVNTYTVGGTITGFTAGTLELTNGSDRLTLTGPNDRFTFMLPVQDDAVYGVAVLAQPAGKTCTVTNGTARMGAGNVTNIVVNCV